MNCQNMNFVLNLETNLSAWRPFFPFHPLMITEPYTVLPSITRFIRIKSHQFIDVDININTDIDITIDAFTDRYMDGYCKAHNGITNQ